MEAGGILWALQIVVGPIVLAIALIYALSHYRRRRRLQGEGSAGPRTRRDMVIYGIPVAILVLLLAALMLIPGSR